MDSLMLWWRSDDLERSRCFLLERVMRRGIYFCDIDVDVNVDVLLVNVDEMIEFHGFPPFMYLLNQVDVPL